MYDGLWNLEVKQVCTASKPHYSYRDTVSRCSFPRNNSQVKHVLFKRHNAKVANCTAQSHCKACSQFDHYSLCNNLEQLTVLISLQYYQILICIFWLNTHSFSVHAVAQLVEALRLEAWMSRVRFPMESIETFHYGLWAQTASGRNEYQIRFLYG